MDISGTETPKVVHAFMPRSSGVYKIEEAWDTLGLRAPAS